MMPVECASNTHHTLPNSSSLEERVKRLSCFRHPYSHSQSTLLSELEISIFNLLFFLSLPRKATQASHVLDHISY